MRKPFTVSVPVPWAALLVGVPLLSMVSVAPMVAGCAGRSRRGDALPPAPAIPVAIAARPATSPVAVPAVLTAQEAVRLARARNPGLGVASARIEAAIARLAASRAAFLPRLSADASVLRADSPSTYLFKRIDQRGLAAGTDFNDPGRITNTEAGVTLRWNLWNGGRDVLARWATSIEVESARAGRDAAENALVAGVLAAFLEGRAATELIAADDASVASVEAQVADMRVKVEGGGALKSDLLSLEVRLAEAQERRIRTDGARRLAIATLRDLLGLEAEASLELAPSGYDPGPLPPAGPAALAEAYRSRPEVHAARRAVERARIGVESARRGGGPRLDLEGRLYGDDDGLSFSPERPNWTVALGLSVDLFDGGARAAAAAEARAALRGVEEDDRRALLAVTLDVESAYVRLDEARARCEVTARAVAAAQESLGLVETQFRGGSVTVTRFLEAESARTEAKTGRIRARLDLERASVDVARALGRLGREPTSALPEGPR